MYNIDNLDRIVRILRKAVYRPGGNNVQSLILPSLQFFLGIQALECYYYRMASENYSTLEPFTFLLSC